MFVLSVIHPPEGEAKHGKAEVPEQKPFTSAGSAIMLVAWVFGGISLDTVTLGEAREIGRGLMDAPGREIKHGSSGLTFRIDKVEDAPHPCPCCRGLVLPTDHAYAHDEDASCLGCFTWDRKIPPCLPENSAHVAEDEQP